MAKIFDITDKLSFDSNPALMIKGKKLEVNADAPTMLKVMGVMSAESPGPNEVMQAYNLIFPAGAREEIEKLKVSFADLMVIVESAVGLVVGGDSEPGEH